MKNLRIIGAVAAAALALGLMQGCAMQPLTGTAYTAGQVRSVQKVQRGTVIGIRVGHISPGDRMSNFLNPSPAQQAGGVGGLLGALAGSSLGGGRGRLVLTVGGAIAGAVMGQRAAHRAEMRKADTLTIQLKSGQTIAVTQQTAASAPFRKGEPVEVLTSGDGTVRVIADNTLGSGQAPSR